MKRDATKTLTGEKSRRTKKRWSDFSRRQQTAIVFGAIAELIITSIALADLARRQGREVRGSKPLWFVTFFVQPFGPLLYFLVGRRHTTR